MELNNCFEHDLAGGRLRIKTIILLLLSLFWFHPASAEVDFDDLTGSDLGMGLGARAIGMGGAFAAVADDASAVYWNPAGLAQLTGNELFVAGDYPGVFGGAGVVFRPPVRGLSDRLAMGVSMVKRLHFNGNSGDEPWDDYSATLLSLAMVDTDADFKGAVHSGTTDIRFSMGMALLDSRRLLLGINYIHLD